MPIRLSNIRLGVDEPEAGLASAIHAALEVRATDVQRWRILRKSLDARNRRDIVFIYSLEVALAEDEAALVARSHSRAAPFEGSPVKAELYAEPPFELPPPGSEPLAERPVIVGAGPAGVVAAYFLAAAGYRPLVIERGQAVRERIRDVKAFDAGGQHDPESNYLFGEGGAGTFSDGKLTCRASGPDVRRVLELFAECKGKPSIVYDNRPHLGSNRLPAVVKAMRQRVEALGGEFRFGCRVEDLGVNDGAIRWLDTSGGRVPAGVVVLAIGHSARDTYEMLHRRGVAMTPKAFQLGLRIEQSQEQVNRAQYGPTRLEDKLGAADYSLVARGEQNLFTFCMCAGGYVMPSVSEPGYFSTNGMSLSGRASPFANSGMMITLEPAHFGGSGPLAGVELQRRFERLAFELAGGDYRCPIQRVDDFLSRRRSKGSIVSSYPRGVTSLEMSEVVPPQVVAALRSGLPLLDRRWRGQFLASATLVGPEARGSAPVRFPRRDDTLESTSLGGLIPIGEGAGYAGGIISAALDGLRAAKAIIRRYAPLDSR